MNMISKNILFLFSLILFNNLNSSGQDILNKRISIKLEKVTLAKALMEIEKAGSFYFSFSDNLIDTDSLVSIEAKGQKVQSILTELLGNRFKYLQQGVHLIIQESVSQNFLHIKGVVVDRVTGEPVPYATVYEPRQLVATMTDEQGNFNLYLKSRTIKDSLSVSRISYSDTLIPIPIIDTKPFRIPITLVSKSMDSVIVSMMDQQQWLSRVFLTNKLRMNSLNLDSFFIKQPFQFSLLPGLGSRGKMSTQLVNKFSFNILGGFNGGVKGAEIGGLYNITNRDVKYVQVAGLFNWVGGKSEGVQIGGLFNKTGFSKGFQAAGILNQNKRSEGMQLAGLVNRSDTTSGVHLSGIVNKSKNSNGLAIAGITNISKKSKGFQLAGILNKTEHFSGFQMALLNVTDTAEGVSIGLINIIRNGYYKAALHYNEMGMGTLSFKSGNKKLYNILALSSRLDPQSRAYGFGYGLGSNLSLIHKRLFLDPELTSLYFYNGNSNLQNISGRLQINLRLKIVNGLSISGGPAFTTLFSRTGIVPMHYQSDLSNGAHIIDLGTNWTGWVGWSVGLEFL